MKLVLEPEQLQIKEAAARFLSEQAPVSAFRDLRDRRDELGYSSGTWKELAAMGFTGVAISERHGGLGLGFSALGTVLEQSGRRLFASPLIATSVAAAGAIEYAGTDVQRDTLLPRVATGDLTLALAVDEGSRHEPATIASAAVRTDSGYLLNGRKSFVPDGHSADMLVVAARVESRVAGGEIAFFTLDRDTPNIRCTRTHMVDSRNAAHIEFDNVILDENSRLGADSSRPAVFDHVLDRARICLAAEMLGGIVELFERTVDYLKQREQFGVKIGSFQALKHRAARLYVDIELTRSAVMAALSALDEASDEVPMLSSLGKLRANETYRAVSNEAIQLHGGIGVTDALDIGLFLKRARICAQLFGDTRYHRDRYATLAGY